MGSTQSTPNMSAEIVLTAVVLAGALAVGYSQVQQKPSNRPQASASSGKKEKKKKRGDGELEVAGPSTSSRKTQAPTNSNEVQSKPSNVVPFPEIIPGSFDSTTTTDAARGDTAPKPKKSKKKGKSAAVESAGRAARASSADNRSDVDTDPDGGSASTPQPPAKQKQKRAQPAPAPSPIDTDSSWTRVESRRAKNTLQTQQSSESGLASEPGARTVDNDATSTSDAGATDPSPVAERSEDRSSIVPNIRKTLAERLLPKPRRTGVDDMLETPDYPSLSRVMRVQPRSDEKPATGFSWGDYEDVATGNDADGEDDGWGVVKSRGRSKQTRSPSSQSSVSTGQIKASETLTKRQRQNAQKRQAQKSAKAEAEAERLAILNRHTREVEKLRMQEQEKRRGKVQSGGMRASVDENGKLVWQ